MAINLDDIVALDVHVHIEADDNGHTALPQSFLDWSASYFHSGAPRTPGIDEIADKYRELNMAAVVFTVDCEASLGQPRITNEYVAAGAARNDDVLIPFASIDPARGRAGVEELRRLIETAGVKGVKFHPSVQDFTPNDGRADGLYEILAEHGMPALFHTGHTGIGAGMPGGGGIRIAKSNPISLDDVAADYPEMPIILAHCAVPWQEEAMSMATHKGNVYLDLSGWAPKYLPQSVVRAMNGPLRRKFLGATDYPVIETTRWLREFENLDIKPEVRPLILKENAARMLNLA